MKARIIITFNCKRNCSYCCNKYTKIIKGAKDLYNLKDIKNYKEYIITGGEPMLYPKKVIKLIKELRIMNPKAKIYMYTTLFDFSILDIIKVIDGVHYTLHANTVEHDINMFYDFQKVASVIPNKSFRLYIHNTMSHPVTILPSAWSRVEMKDWIKEDSCELPKGEKLFILKEILK